MSESIPRIYENDIPVDPRRQVSVWYGSGKDERIEVRRIPSLADKDYRLSHEAEVASLALLGSKPELFEEETESPDTPDEPDKVPTT